MQRDVFINRRSNIKVKNFRVIPQSLLLLLLLLPETAVARPIKPQNLLHQLKRNLSI